MTTLAADDDTRRPSTPVVQMTISTPETVDLMGRFLPAGNYYFTAKHFYKDMICGSLQSKGVGTFGEFCFTNKELVRMMAIAQSRLARRRHRGERHADLQPRPRAKEEAPEAAHAKVCSICFDSITTSPKELPCKHEFHPQCIEQWFRRGKNTCPLCRAAVPQLPSIAGRRRTPHVLPLAPTRPTRYPRSQRPVYRHYGGPYRR